MNFITRAYRDEQVTYQSRRSVEQMETRLIELCEKESPFLGTSLDDLSGTMNEDGSFTIKHTFRMLTHHNNKNAELIVGIKGTEPGCFVQLKLKPPFITNLVVLPSFIIGFIMIVCTLVQPPIDGGILFIDLMIMLGIPGYTLYHSAESKRNLRDAFAFEFNLDKVEE